MDRRSIIAGKLLNIYEDNNSLSLADQYRATRIYITLFIIVLLGLILSAQFNPQSVTETILFPSRVEFENLLKKYSSTLVCPCARTILSYENLISFTPKYHSICSSRLIEQDWIVSLLPDDTNDYLIIDYRLTAPSQFYFLSILCHSSQQAVSDAFQQFTSSHMVSKDVLSSEIFHADIDVHIAQVKSMTRTDMSLIYRYIYSIATQNRLISALRTNYLVNRHPGDVELYVGITVPYPIESCTCLRASCVYPSRIYNWTQGKTTTVRYNVSGLPSSLRIPGIQTGCLPTSTLFASTLECFFDESCLNIIKNYTSNLSPISPLNNTMYPSIFESNTTIDKIFDQLMVIEWNYESDYDAYYHECAPQSCTYSYQNQFDLIYLLTLILGLCGGLSAAIDLISIVIVRYIIPKLIKSNQCREMPVEENPINHSDLTLINVRHFLVTIFTQCRQSIVQLNLFEKEEANVRVGIVSTRLYGILWIIGVLILCSYLKLIKARQTVAITRPSRSQFEELYHQQRLTLLCPCQHLTMHQSDIMTITPDYHQICASDFVDTDRWFSYWNFRLINGSNGTIGSFFTFDFRLTGHPFFTLLRTFCVTAAEAVNNAITVFNASEFLSGHVLGRDDFHTQTSLIMNRFTSQVNP